MVPENKNINEQQQKQYCAEAFRAINYYGKKLSNIEIRGALYHIESGLENFFKLEKEQEISPNVQIDLIKYISLSNQYTHFKEDESKVAKGCGDKHQLEEFYERYMCNIITDNDKDEFGEFPSEFKDEEYSKYSKKIQSLLNKILSSSNKFEIKSIIDLDLILFVLTYHILFERNQEIDESEIGKLLDKLKHSSQKFKEKADHKKSPAKLKFLRERLKESISIYSELFKLNNE